MTDHESHEDLKAIDPGTIEGIIHPEQYEDVPGDPKGDPVALEDGYEVYAAETMNGIVPKWLAVMEHPEDEPVHSRHWVFAGLRGIMVFHAYYRHRYGGGHEMPADEAALKPCCFRIERDHGLSVEHCPDAVRDLVARYADAPVASLNDDDHSDDDAAEE